jgi:uncharacterized protein involved in exopolysaccharide biosynthesis/Mrp family chromosome partitioning ATPase
MQDRVNALTITAPEAGPEAGARQGQSDFDRLSAAARRQARVVAITAVVGLLLGLAYVVSAVPQYTAKTDILIDSPKNAFTFDAGAIDSQVEVMKSDEVALSVVSTLKLMLDPEFTGTRVTLVGRPFSLLRSLFDVGGWFPTGKKSDVELGDELQRAALLHLKGNLDVRRVGRTYVMEVAYTSPDRGKAAAISNAFAEAYLTEQRNAKSDATQRAETQLAKLNEELNESDLAIQRFKADHNIADMVGERAAANQTLVQLRELERESETYRTLYQAFMQRYQEALQQQTFPVSDASIITVASAPQTPSHPKRSLVLGLALVLGAIVGSGVGALREYRDRGFRVASHVRDELGLEFLGMLPGINTKMPAKLRQDQVDDPKCIRSTNRLLRYSIDDPLSSFSETLRSAKVAVDLAPGKRRRKVVGVISVLPSEGKSTVSKNFASLLAHHGARTLLIDADLRNPGRLSRTIAPHVAAGLLEAIRGERPLAECLLLEPESGLLFLPTVVEKRVTHSSEIVSSIAMRNLVAEQTETFDYVVVDLPALGPIVDVRAAASMFDAFVCVIEWGRTPRILVQTLLSSDDTLYEKCVGVVYNKVNLKRIKLYEGYGSKDYYYGRYAKYYQQHNGKV